jgi:hypothetical protein
MCRFIMIREFVVENGALMEERFISSSQKAELRFPDSFNVAKPSFDEVSMIKVCSSTYGCSRSG